MRKPKMIERKDGDNFIPEDDSALRKAFTIEKGDGGWSLVTVTYEGKKILDIERTEPDLKAIAIEKFKIAAFRYWSSIG